MNCPHDPFGRSHIARLPRMGGNPAAATNVALWGAALTARLDLASPRDHAGIVADAIREAVRLYRDGTFAREAAIDVLVTVARIFALTTTEIEEACMWRRCVDPSAGFFRITSRSGRASREGSRRHGRVSGRI
jgi:hypothetical protein